jgi:competence protein ComEC
MKKIIIFLSLVTISVWVSVFSIDSNLHIIACDVGQGDAILIQKHTTQILIDGGPNQNVLNCLGKHMPFWDRQIEMVILTHPEADHYSGLIDVFKNYKVVNFGQNNTNSSNQTYQVLKNVVGGTTTATSHLDRGTTIRAGMIQLDVVWPTQQNTSSNGNPIAGSTNNNGVVLLMKYAQFKALFTADVENKVSDELLGLNEIENLNYIKVNHHGSRHGMSQKLLDAVSPQIAVISVSSRNSYGHPSAEIIDMLTKKNVKILRTDELGDVEIVTNGKDFWAKK